jgi:hypothetical protein
MTPDRGRQAVYAAEIAAFEGTSYEVVTSIESLIELAATITAAEWWPRGPIPVVRARSDASSSSTRQRGHDRPIVRLAAPQMTPATLLHELAHVLAGVGLGHGSVFRRAHVDLVGCGFGHGEAIWLGDAYRSMDLTLGARAWSAPPLRGAAPGPVAL